MKKRISEAIPRIETAMAPHRSIAYDALTDIMLDALTEVHKALEEELPGAYEGWSFDRNVCGFRPEQMEKVATSGGPERLIQWFASMDEQEKMSLLMSFLDWERLRLNDFRARFPNSYQKWSAADDEALLEMYSTGSSWGTLSDHFGRNVNAVKLRLQYLGVDLGAEAARPRFPRRRATAPADQAQRSQE